MHWGSAHLGGALPTLLFFTYLGGALLTWWGYAYFDGTLLSFPVLTDLGTSQITVLIFVTCVAHVFHNIPDNLL